MPAGPPGRPSPGWSRRCPTRTRQPPGKPPAWLATTSQSNAALSMGGAFVFPADDGLVTFNDPAIQAAEVPGANGISTAESLARLYAACVGPIDGTTAPVRTVDRGRAPGPVGWTAAAPACLTMAPGGGPDSSSSSPPGSPCSVPPASATPGRVDSSGSRTPPARGRLRLPQQPDGRLWRCAGPPADARPRPRPRRLTGGRIRTVRPGDISPRPQLLTYPDSLGGDLPRLNALLDGPLDGLFHGIHILPPFPSSGDRGFAPLTYRRDRSAVRDVG